MNAREHYLELLKKVLTNVIYEDAPLPFMHVAGIANVQPNFDARMRENGRDWPSIAHTMVGLKRLNNLQSCMERVITERIPGDFLEAGVWRGGVCIFMRAFLQVHRVRDRTVWVADSFQGVPDVGSNGHSLDAQLGLHRANDVLAVPLETVRTNFARYGVLDEQVRFLSGWFCETLADAPISQLAILRLDGDLYESTFEVLERLHAKVSNGGFVIVDDYAMHGCRCAVEEFRSRHRVADQICQIDESSAYWRRGS